MKFYGPIGFSVMEKKAPGRWAPTIVEKNYSGDILKLTRRLDGGEHINDGLRINAQISILIDAWFRDNLQNLAYVTYMDTKWKIESIDPSYPRVNLTLGDLYVENKEEEDENGYGSSDYS